MTEGLLLIVCIVLLGIQQKADPRVITFVVAFGVLTFLAGLILQ